MVEPLTYFERLYLQRMEARLRASGYDLLNDADAAAMRKVNARRHVRRIRQRIGACALVALIGVAFIRFSIGKLDMPRTLTEWAVLLVGIAFFGVTGALAITMAGGLLWAVCYLYVKLIPELFGYRLAVRAHKRHEEK